MSMVCLKYFIQTAIQVVVYAINTVNKKMVMTNVIKNHFIYLLFFLKKKIYTYEGEFCDESTGCELNTRPPDFNADRYSRELYQLSYRWFFIRVNQSLDHVEKKND